MMILVYIGLVIARDNGAHISPWIMVLSLIFALVEAALYVMMLVAWIIGIITIWRDR